MARAKLYYVPGVVWHITQRCHNRDFLLRYFKDKKNWLAWLFQAKKKYGLIILNYTVTSNHIHLLVYDDGRRLVIPRSMLLIASQTALHFNQRKNRSGAFWDNNYHATAVEKGEHLIQCLIYIDLNMVRAGVISHPKEWPFSGYNEIHSNRQRYKLIDKTKLIELSNVANEATFKSLYQTWIESSLEAGELERKNYWTESLALGSEEFVTMMKNKLGIKANYRKIKREATRYELHDQRNPYR